MGFYYGQNDNGEISHNIYHKNAGNCKMTLIKILLLKINDKWKVM